MSNFSDNRYHVNHLRITTAELAQLCGVSQGTVDRALNNRSGISPETKERILKTAIQYGFRNVSGNTKCDDSARKQIGVIVFNLHNEYFGKLITEIESQCQGLGYTTLVMFTNYDKQREIESIRRMYSMGVAGIILCAVNSGSEFGQYLKNFGIPVVAVGNDIQSIPYVGIDDFAAMKAATEHVMLKSPRNVIYFSPAIQYEDAYAQKRRFEGFLAAVPPGFRYSVITDIEKIREEYPEDTVVLCSTDYYALQVFFKVKNAAVMGFDNIDILEKYRLPISSVAYNVAEIAREAVEYIVCCKVGGNRLVEYWIVER